MILQPPVEQSDLDIRLSYLTAIGAPWDLRMKLVHIVNELEDKWVLKWRLYGGDAYMAYIFDLTGERFCFEATSPERG